jgi:AbrB family looped-hinge helix DNA binding protein
MPKIVGASKITSRYQVTIPAEVRSKLKISVGDTLAFVEEGDKVYVMIEV